MIRIARRRCSNRRGSRSARGRGGSLRRRRRSRAEAGATVRPRLEEAGADSLDEAGAAEPDRQRWIPPGEEGGQRTTTPGEFFTICCCWTTFYDGGSDRSAARLWRMARPPAEIMDDLPGGALRGRRRGALEACRGERPVAHEEQRCEGLQKGYGLRPRILDLNS